MQMFSPAFSPSLIKNGATVAPENMYKPLTKADLKKLSVDTPIIVKQASLSKAHAKLLKGWLNDNASDEIPGWFTTALGIAIPVQLVGLAADVAVQLINGNGDAGRLKLANVAGTVSEGGKVGVLHRVTDGGKKYIWSYMYTAELNKKFVTFMLQSCQADVLIR